MTVDISPTRRKQIQAVADAFARPSGLRSGLQLGGGLLLYLGASAGALWCWQRGLAALLALSVVIAAGSLARLMLLQHELAHRSLFAAARANDRAGALLSLVTFVPHALWRTAHALHHRNFSKLDGPGTGYLWTLSTVQYAALSPRRRLAYRCYRHPLLALAFGALFYFLVLHRVAGGASVEERRGVWRLNAALCLLYGGLAWWLGPTPLLWLVLASVQLGGGVVIWLFWVQHSHEHGYWRESADWDFVRACLEGSSCLRLPAWAEWWTLHVTLHHAHHLAPRVPNYRLAAFTAALPELGAVPSLRFTAALRAPFNALWAPEQQRMIRFVDLETQAAQRAALQECS